jgi:hypothetical protein
MGPEHQDVTRLLTCTERREREGGRRSVEEAKKGLSRCEIRQDLCTAFVPEAF